MQGTGTTEEAASRPEAAFAAGCAWIEGRFVPIGEARIPLLDWGFLRGDCTYDTVHVWRGRFFRLQDHLDRFLRNVGRLRLSLPVDRIGLEAILHGCVARSGLEDAYVQAIATRGPPLAGSRDPRLCSNRLYAYALPFIWIATPERQEQGLHLLTSSVQRVPEASVDPTIKNFNWLDLMGGLFEALDRGADLPVLVDGQGGLTEGPGFNLFLVCHGRLATPARGVLDGITRRTVIELAHLLQIAVELREVGVDELLHAEELFATTTAGGILPI
ncbi:MAG: aminotransferase class IV, partial [Geminicoccaceae bacterium]|nr:aminotransferase class IV [Geminicoccaceae bacterium]